MCPRRLRDVRARISADDGTSLVELGVVVGVFGVVAAALIGFLTSSQATIERQASRTISNDEVRLAVESLDREIRSGNVVYDPAEEVYAAGDVVAGMSLRVYARTNNDPRCIQWRVTSAGELQRRAWTPYWYPGKPGATVTGWRIVSTDVRNRAEGIPAFTRPQTNIVKMRFRVNRDATGKKGSTVDVTQSVGGRNTAHFPTGASSEVCGPPVPDPNLAGAGRVPPYS